MRSLALVCVIITCAVSSAQTKKIDPEKAKAALAEFTKKLGESDDRLITYTNDRNSVMQKRELGERARLAKSIVGLPVELTLVYQGNRRGEMSYEIYHPYTTPSGKTFRASFVLSPMQSAAMLSKIAAEVRPGDRYRVKGRVADGSINYNERKFLLLMTGYERLEKGLLPDNNSK